MSQNQLGQKPWTFIVSPLIDTQFDFLEDGSVWFWTIFTITQILEIITKINDTGQDVIWQLE